MKTKPVFWIRRINIVSIHTLPKATYSPNAVSAKIPKAFFIERGKKNPTKVWNHKNPEWPKQS